MSKYNKEGKMKKVRFNPKGVIYIYKDDIQDKSVKNKVSRGIYRKIKGLRNKILMYYYLNY